MPAGHKNQEGVLSHPLLQPGRLRPPPPPLPLLQGSLPSPWKPLGARGDRLSIGHGLFLWQPVLLGPDAGLHQHQALPGRGAPVHVQDSPQEGVHGVGQRGRVGGVRRRRRPRAPRAAELSAPSGGPHHLPRRAASGRGLPHVPALLLPVPNHLRPGGAAGAHGRVLRPNRLRAEPVEPGLGDVHQGQLSGVCHLPGVFHSRWSPALPPSPAAVRGRDGHFVRAL